ncbi:S1/P1 nuclease [Tenacibaculum sp. SG-28]|uniref:S1/P1 nuclease n=1 Tax=Tenacibaculum sp. SG-28 TaxID=754426 RepID=UPI000CF58172|nr:S1/P1 nuclease [Tenacibaculum sp. SG-28]PQJ22898.1 S1/P1 Nuclease [Tenacibaculum sp. SG-28]
MKTTRLVFLTLFLGIPLSLFSIDLDWGATGHRVTGKIAEKHLTNKAKKKIEKLLAGESLAFVSTFADEIKADKKYKMYSVWHYVNMALDETYEGSVKNPTGDIVTGISNCINVLKDENSDAEKKRFHLKMLVHLMGDLHQPMHIGQREDKGGNTIQVQWHGKGSNLHRVWDSNIINEWGMSYVELSNNAKRLSASQVKEIQKGNVLEWMRDTHELTKEVYASAKKGDNLRYGYSYKFLPIVREQLQKGGLRLAKLLNEIFS